jgi:hypothetical protein
MASSLWSGLPFIRGSTPQSHVGPQNILVFEFDSTVGVGREKWMLSLLRPLREVLLSPQASNR